MIDALEINSSESEVQLLIQNVQALDGQVAIYVANAVKPFFYRCTGDEGNVFQPQNELGAFLLSRKIILEFKLNNEELWPVGVDVNGEQLYPNNEEYAYNENGTFTRPNDFDQNDKIKILYTDK